MHPVVNVAAPILAGAVLLTGCGRSVTVDPLPINSEQTRAACEQLIADLPLKISAGRSWAVEPDPHSALAWGSPPVVLRCGDEVPQPAPTDQLLTVNGLTWLVTPLTQGEQYTTVDRAPGVIVTVPDIYVPTSAVLAEFAPIIDKDTTGPA